MKNDPKPLKKAVRKTYQMDLAEMGRHGWEWMKDDFGWYHISKLMLQIYQEVMVGN